MLNPPPPKRKVLLGVLDVVLIRRLGFRDIFVLLFLFSHDGLSVTQLLHALSSQIYLPAKACSVTKLHLHYSQIFHRNC